MISGFTLDAANKIPVQSGPIIVTVHGSKLKILPIASVHYKLNVSEYPNGLSNGAVMEKVVGSKDTPYGE